MRDIEDYEQQYIRHDFERYQGKYRRVFVKKVIDIYAKENCSILEIGCGLTPLFLEYQDRYFFTIIEPAAHCYENAKMLSEKYSKVSCYQGFFEEIVEQIKENRFDIIICSALLHEVEDPGRLLRAIRLICESQTVVHINVPNALSFHRLLAKEMGMIQSVYQLSAANLTLQQNSVFDLENLGKMVEGEGYQIIDSGSYFMKPFTHKQMQQCMDAQILNEDILEGLYRLCEAYFAGYGSEIYVNVKIK